MMPSPVVAMIFAQIAATAWLICKPDDFLAQTAAIWLGGIALFVAWLMPRDFK
jgi:hypothetical protein